MEMLGWHATVDLGQDWTACKHDLLFLGSIKGYETDLARLPKGKYVNRFPGMNLLVRKAQLSKVLQAHGAASITPQTWVLDSSTDLTELYTLAESTALQSTCYIMKPDDGAKGEDIKIFGSLREAVDHYRYDHCKETHVLQEYLPKPLLLRGYKFDLRLYVLVTDLWPMTVYLCQEGLARFCVVPYQRPAKSNVRVAQMHLTPCHA